MTTTAYIVGKGGQARVIASLLPHRTIRFLVESDPQGDDLLQTDFFEAGGDPDGDYFLGIGDTGARRRWFDDLDARGLSLPPCIAPNAWVAGDAQVGRGTFVGPSAIVAAGARLQDNVILNTMSSVDHDALVGTDTQITPGVTIGSRLQIGARCYFGMKSCVLPGLTIGDDAVIMAGALVVRPVPSGVMVGGAPARAMRGPPRDGAATKAE